MTLPSPRLQVRPGLSDRAPTRVVIDDHVDKIGVCELTFAVPEGRDPFEGCTIGAPVRVGGTEDAPLFTGSVVGVRHRYDAGRHELIVEAADARHGLDRTRRTRTFGDPARGRPRITDAEVARSVLSEAGVSIGDVDATGPSHATLLQRNETDLRLLRRLAARNGYAVSVRGGAVCFAAPRMSEARLVSMRDVQRFDYAVTPREAPPEVHVVGWSYHDKRTVHGHARHDRAVAEAPERADISDLFVASPALADAVAQAELDRLSRSVVRGRATLSGDPALTPDRVLALPLRPTEPPVEIYVVGVRHVDDPSLGYATEIQFCAATLAGVVE